MHRFYGISVNSSPTIFKLENDPRTVELSPIIFIFEAPSYYSDVYSETQVHNTKLNGGLSDWSIAPS